MGILRPRVFQWRTQWLTIRTWLIAFFQRYWNLTIKAFPSRVWHVLNTQIVCHWVLDWKTLGRSIHIIFYSFLLNGMSLNWKRSYLVINPFISYSQSHDKHSIIKLKLTSRAFKPFGLTLPGNYYAVMSQRMCLIRFSRHPSAYKFVLTTGGLHYCLPRWLWLWATPSCISPPPTSYYSTLGFLAGSPLGSVN